MFIIYLFLTIILYQYFPHHFNLIKNILQNTGIKLAYNIIYFYGVCQIKCNQLYNYVLPFFKKNIKDDSKPEIDVFNITTNKIVLKKEYDETFDKNQKLDYPVVILISDSSHVNKKILYDLEKCNNQFDTSDITFIALYLKYDNAQYHINLKTDKYNYYLVGNVINKLFLQYYINTILNHTNFTMDDTKSYSLELMDHEVNMVYLDITQSIIIEKNGYHINTIKTEDIK